MIERRGTRRDVSALREAAVVVGAQVAILWLIGLSPAALVVSSACPAYVLAVRWADPGASIVPDLAMVVALVAVATSPVALFADGWLWSANLVAVGSGALLGRVRLLPVALDQDAVGVEAHLRHVRAHGEDRKAGRAESATLGAGHDPLGGMLGNVGIPAVAEDPYEDSQSLHIDPEKDL